jgi:hypothetical protein
MGAESAAGGRPPLAWEKLATAAQVAGIAAGILAMGSGQLMWRIALDTLLAPDGAWSPLPNSLTTWNELPFLAPAGAGALAAIAALTLRGRARWLRHPQIGLWLLTLASSIHIAATCDPFTGPGPLRGPLAVGDAPAVIPIALLTLSRPARKAAGTAAVPEASRTLGRR